MKEIKKIIDKYLHTYEPIQNGIITKVNTIALT